jgi:hypothetical protein
MRPSGQITQEAFRLIKTLRFSKNPIVKNHDGIRSKYHLSRMMRFRGTGLQTGQPVDEMLGRFTVEPPFIRLIRMDFEPDARLGKQLAPPRRIGRQNQYFFRIVLQFGSFCLGSGAGIPPSLHPTARRRRYIGETPSLHRRDAVATSNGGKPSLHPTARRRRYIQR